MTPSELQTKFGDSGVPEVSVVGGGAVGTKAFGASIQGVAKWAAQLIF
jgi:hypothetical protein